MLPRCPVNRLATMSDSAKCRYVDFTIRAMARRLDALHARRSEIEVKLFGGADVLTVSKNATRPSVGRLNCEAAMRVLEEEGFEIAASSLGGKQGVHIRFQTVTGEVRLRRLDCIPSLDQTESGKKPDLSRVTGSETVGKG
jgi:chemotaxis receptor (MCP) glutamine deamidase CheD